MQGFRFVKNKFLKQPVNTVPPAACSGSTVNQFARDAFNTSSNTRQQNAFSITSRGLGHALATQSCMTEHVHAY